MFTDAYDVLYTETSRVMRLKFDALGAPLLFSGECGCWPQVTYDKGATCRDKYPHSPTPYRYLNSGSWMGRAGVAARFLRTIVDEASRGKSGASFHKLNDQELASDLYFRGTFGPELRLDHFAQLFQAMHAVRDKSAVPDCDPPKPAPVGKRMPLDTQRRPSGRRRRGPPRGPFEDRPKGRLKGRVKGRLGDFARWMFRRRRRAGAGGRL